MRTELLLLAQYDGRTIIPVELICRDFFSHLSPERLIRKVNDGQIKLVMIRMDGSIKTARGIHVVDLALYLDERRQAAKKELEQLFRGS